MRARDAEITAIDFEATGTVEDFPNEPWQIGLVCLRGPALGEQWESLLRVGDRPFNAYAPGRHHELRREIAAAPTLTEQWPTVRDWCCGRPLAAHNIGTEKTFLERSAPLHQFGPWIDTLKLTRYAYPNLPSHSLEDLVDHFGLSHAVAEACPGRAPHDALFDAVACAVLLQHILDLPGWEEVTVADLAAIRPTAYHKARARKR